jgi:hypothetical protein
MIRLIRLTRHSIMSSLSIRAVVAINVDTLYASAFFSLTNEPLIVTVPSTSTVYSVFMLD